MGKKRTIEWFVKTDNSMEGLRGRSIDFGVMEQMKKKLTPGDNPEKSKYQSIHFLKNITMGYPQNPALREAAAMEFMRLMIPRQPKTRAIYNESQTIEYVQSKGIPQASSLSHIEGKDEPKLSLSNYGTENGYKGAGELWFFTMWVLKDKDHFGYNVMVDNDGWLYRIDGGQMLWFASGGKLVDVYHQALLKNSVYVHELQKSALKTLALSDELIEIFMANFKEENIFTSDYLKEKREQLREVIDSGRISNEQLDKFIPGLRYYLSTEQAKLDLAEHRQHVESFLAKQNPDLPENTVKRVAADMNPFENSQTGLSPSL